MEGGELDGPGREARGVQVEVEGCECVSAVLGEKLDAQGISIERFREGDDIMVIESVNVGGKDNGNPSCCLGETAVFAGMVFW